MSGNERHIGEPIEVKKQLQRTRDGVSNVDAIVGVKEHELMRHVQSNENELRRRSSEPTLVSIPTIPVKSLNTVGVPVGPCGSAGRFVRTEDFSLNSFACEDAGRDKVKNERDDDRMKLRPQQTLLLQEPEKGEDAIDPALLSALRDPKERRNVLRLEQLLVDFMNEKTLGFIQIGGASSSPALPGYGAALQNSLSGAKLQTSFHRRCLHRLADRFGIARETSFATTANPQGYSYGTASTASPSSAFNLIVDSGSGAFLPRNTQTPVSSTSNFVVHPIRLVKTSVSKLPFQLLIDLNVSPESDYNPPPSCEKDAIAVSLINDLNKAFSTSSLDTGSKTATRASASATGKMRIMKRNSSASGGRNSENDCGALNNESGLKGARRKVRGKKLSDREKAYAEARARIFAEDHGVNATPVDDVVEDAENDVKPDFTGSLLFEIQSAHSSPVNASGSNGSSNGDLDGTTEMPPVQYQVSDADTYALPSQIGDTVEANVKKAGRSSDARQVSRPPGGSKKNKATWRNRRQEENDPDFRRQRGGNVVQNSPMTVHAGYSTHPHVPGSVQRSYSLSDRREFDYAHQMQQQSYLPPGNDMSGFDSLSRIGGANISGAASVAPSAYFPQHHQAYFPSCLESAYGASLGGARLYQSSLVAAPSLGLPKKAQDTKTQSNYRKGDADCMMTTAEQDRRGAERSNNLASSSVYHAEFPAL